MKCKRIPCLILALLLLCSLLGCDAAPSGKDEEAAPVELTMWLYPLGDWSNASVQKLLADFTAENPHITVRVTELTDEDGSGTVSTAIEAGDGPDILLGSLSQLQHAIRRGGEALSMTELWPDENYSAVKSACTNADGLLYALPVAMDVLCMAINYEVFQATDSLQYIDEVNHTWTTENFIKAIKSVRSADLCPDTLALYCAGQNGDAGTRALVTNMYGGSFTNETHTRYTLNSEENIKALTDLQDLRSVIFDDEIVGDDENVLFAQQQLAMTLCWDSTQPQPEGFTAFPMAYPTEEGDPQMPGEIWGFSLFDNGDTAKIDAAKSVLSYIVGSGTYQKAAKLAGHYPPRYVLGNDADIYSRFAAMMGSYDLYTPGWAVARTEWYELLQRLGGGADVELEVETFCNNANAAARDQM